MNAFRFAPSTWLLTCALAACASARPGEASPDSMRSQAATVGIGDAGTPLLETGARASGEGGAATVQPDREATESTPAGGAPAISSGATGAAPTSNTDPPDMLLVPGGSFVMGADDEGEQDERPAHSVSVGTFLLDRTEVTNAAYSECVSAGACRAPASLSGSALAFGRPTAFSGAEQPVVGVSWFDAEAYCTSVGKRLPREAEWERAARGSDGRRYVWGNEAPDPKRHGVFGGRTCTEPVGSYPAGQGPYGHLDLAGNVWEWTADPYDPYAYRRATADRGEPGSCDAILETLADLRRQHKQGFTGKNPIPSECERVLRGAAYNYGVSGVRASNRVHHPASFRIAVAGFRCARDAAPR